MGFPGTEAVARLGLSRPVFVPVLPFAVYSILLALQSALDQNAAIQDSRFDTRWLYSLRIAAVAGVLACYWRDYAEFSAAESGLGGRGNQAVRRVAALLAGLAYGYLYKYTGRLRVPVVAHAVTNFMLGCWVVANGQWHFW